MRDQFHAPNALPTKRRDRYQMGKWLGVPQSLSWHCAEDKRDWLGILTGVQRNSKTVFQAISRTVTSAGQPRKQQMRQWYQQQQ